jgi:hypothetical protein
MHLIDHVVRLLKSSTATPEGYFFAANIDDFPKLRFCYVSSKNFLGDLRVAAPDGREVGLKTGCNAPTGCDIWED